MTTSTMENRRSNPQPNDPPVNGDSQNTATSVESETDFLRKTDSEEAIDEWSSAGYNYINPFVHRLQIDSQADWAKIYVLTVLLLPIRVVGCVLSLISAWMFACIGLYGTTMEDLRMKPLTGWRRHVQKIVAGAMRLVYASGSFHYITFKGKRASPKEAPILVVAPHSSYVDSIIVVACGPPSIVAKQETSQIPLLGKIINYAQPIYVQREDPNSRQNTIREIVRRARSSEDWPQVVIFAEGTCTNRSALIKFKPGAFFPGVPVQPVLLKYPNKHDSFTWTWDGPSVLRLLWLTMTQFYSRCEIEFLPVYTPSPEEIADANLYAKNVRDVMAKALDTPTSEYSFEDVIMMSRAKDMKIPFPGDIVEIERTLHELGLITSNRDEELAADFLNMRHTDQLDVLTFAELLKIGVTDKNLHTLFALLDHRRRGVVSLKSFLLCSLFCKRQNEEIISFLRAITKIYTESSQIITRENFWKIIRHSGKMTESKANALFYAIDDSYKGHISFDEFERHTKGLPQYNYLYKQQEHIRRTFSTKQ